MRYSRQRELVLDEVRGRGDHPTADEIYQSVRDHCPSVSLGTVYRNLSGLAERGEIRRVPVPGQADRFDKTTRQHTHMFCNSCKRLMDAELPERELKEFLNHKVDFCLEDYSLTLYGVCRACQKKNEH